MNTKLQLLLLKYKFVWEEEERKTEGPGNIDLVLSSLENIQI
jgi:hypothetical protein